MSNRVYALNKSIGCRLRGAKNEQGIKILISPYYISLIAAVCIIDESSLVVISLLCALVHEAGHLLAAAMLGRLKAVFCVSIPVMTIKNYAACSYWQEIIICTAGPLANLVTAAVFGWLLRLPNIATVSMALFVINSLPIGALDAGRVLYCFLCLAANPTVAQRIVSALSFVIIVPMIILGFALLFVTGKNFSLLAIGIFLLISQLNG